MNYFASRPVIYERIKTWRFLDQQTDKLHIVMDVKVNDGESGDWGLMKTNGMFITSVSSKY